MPEIKEFHGLRYNQKLIKDISRVVAPPYDIISPSRQNELYKIHPNNVIRLELGKAGRTDGPKDNRYTRAKRYMDEWLRKKIMLPEAKPAIYVYSQEYKYSGKRMVRTGFLSLMGIEGDNKVLPHENTLLAPKMDRLNLMKAVKTNLSPIFILYEDKKHLINKIIDKFCRRHKPAINILFEGVRNKVWVLDDEKLLGKIRRSMANKNTFIADGHHRYEVSRMYSKYIKGQPVSRELKENSRYIMVYFAEADDRTLTVLPAHRLVRDASGLSAREILAKLEKYFFVRKVSGLNSMMAGLSKLASSHAFGAYLGSGQFYLLKLKDVSYSDKVIKDKPLDWKRLDVSILHLFVFQYVLGVRDEDDNIEFVKDPAEIPEMIDSKKYKIAFFMNPTKAWQVRRIAKLGERMPRKATYFYPKPISGLVINKH